MKNYVFVPLLVLLIALSACVSSTNTAQSILTPKDFQDKLENTENAQLVDVRTPEEFEGGHIANSLNVDWNGSDFEGQIESIDKSKPVFIYCLSGGRSGQAASYMRKNGYKEVYELEGGMMAWRSAKLAETKDTQVIGSEITTADFEKLITSEKYVLVDFYADWCAPCKKLKPILEEIEAENKDKFVVVRIDADKNPSIAQKLGVAGLPTLKMYKNKSLVWEQTGLVSKEVIVEQLK